ncbi:hypothetical protein Tco_0377086 [Tanacetum coccineum]
MTEPEPMKKSKKLLEQERQGLEEAIRLKQQVDEEERAQVARDEEIARKLLTLDEERVTTDPKTTKDIDWNDPSVQKYWNMKNKPKSKAQARKNIIVYLKNQSNYKIKDFDGMSYDEIRPIFEKVWDFNHNFVPMDLEIEREKKKPAVFQVEQIEKDTTGKRKKSLPRKGTRSTTKRQKVELDDEKEDLKGYLDIVPREEIVVDVDSLSIKYPIMDWKTYTLLENFMYYKIIKGDGSSKNYKILIHILLMQNRIAIHMRKKSLPRKRSRSTVKRQKMEEDVEKEDLKGYLDIVPREDVAEDVESLSTKYPIVDWKTYTLTENFMYYQIFRGDGSSKNYKVLSEMLEDFDRQDVMDLHRLVNEESTLERTRRFNLEETWDLKINHKFREDLWEYILTIVKTQGITNSTKEFSYCQSFSFIQLEERLNTADGLAATLGDKDA